MKYVNVLAKQKNDYAYIPMWVPMNELATLQKTYDIIRVIQVIEKKDFEQSEDQMNQLLKQQ